MRPALELRRQARGSLAMLSYVGKAGRADPTAEYTRGRAAACGDGSFAEDRTIFQCPSREITLHSEDMRDTGSSSQEAHALEGASRHGRASPVHCPAAGRGADGRFAETDAGRAHLRPCRRRAGDDGGRVHARVAADRGRPMGPFSLDPRDLFMACATVRCFDVAADGQRFYTVHRVTPSSPPIVTHIKLIRN